MNKIEVIKQQKDGLDVLGDIYKYARLGFESIPEEDYERMKWYGLFHRRLTPGYLWNWRAQIDHRSKPDHSQCP